MNISLLAIFFMFVCNIMVIFSRKFKNGWVRFLIKALAFLLLLVTLGMILIVLIA
ncbi:DUF2768 family protein [Brevibacillus migulae]|uniref:DUF2768 family protein n=1 Tax=Brevibacillus migulae TaxID=1644114 RepID=UPI0022A7881F|nr:DUF2768 family protein [Brevibacillus migulae]